MPLIVPPQEVPRAIQMMSERLSVGGVYLFPATTSESSISLINPRIILSGSLTDKLQHYTLLPVPSTTQRPVTPRHPGQQVQSGRAEFG